MTFPPAISVAALRATHPQYDAKKITRLQAYFEGGDAFPKAKELRWKPIEKSNDPCAGPTRESRVGASFYNNYFGDTLLDLVSGICKFPIEISDDQDRPYWSNLGDNVDGQFGSANSHARAALIDDFLIDRAFYLVRFPPGEKAGNLGEQLAAGQLDGRISALDGASILDWRLKDDVQLEWAKHYEMELVRSSAIGPYDTELHRWTYYADDAIYVYEATREAAKPGNPPADWPEGAMASLKKLQTHQLAECPVYKVDRCLKCAVGSKLLPTACQLFNEESDASFYAFVTITGGLFIFTDSPGKWAAGVTLSPFCAVIAGPLDKIDRDKPDPSTLQALAAAAAERRSQMGGLIHTMARQSAQQSASGQNTSRATGEALKVQADPLKAFLVAFGQPHVSCFKRMFKAIARLRDDEDISGVQICGLLTDEHFEVDPVDLPTMQAEAAFAALPNVPQEAKAARGIRLGLQANEDAEDEVKDSIRNAKIEPPKPPPAAPVPGSPPPKPEPQPVTK